MKLSVVKSNYKTTAHISLASPTEQFSNYEIIYPTGPSVCHMRNYGASQASGEWILFLDNDCHIDLKFVFKLLDKIKSKANIQVIGGVYKANKNSYLAFTYNILQRVWLLRGLLPDEMLFKKGKHFFGGCLLIKKELFIKSKGYNISIGWGGEELAFQKKLNQLNINVYISFLLRPIHNTNLDLYGFFKRAWVQGKNKTQHGLLTEGNTKVSSLVWHKNFSISFLILSFLVISILGQGYGSWQRAKAIKL